MHIVTVAVVCAALGMSSVSVAAADIGDNQPPGADPAVWRSYVDTYRSGPDWSPRGTVVADTGFRPHPNGFSFFNTGVPDGYNHEMFGTPLAGPKNLDSDVMRDLMGKRVCLERSDTGPCTLTLAGRQWMKATNAAMSGGHCFGFAGTAADLFNRLLTPGQFQPGALQTYDLRLREPISREIARNMATQYTFDVLQYKLSPRKVVKTLKETLRPGTMPFTLFIFWPGGGHAITPYALHDRGSGKYDVAVYDNNYPDAARAIRIDTNKNTYRYLVMTNPNGKAEVAKDVIGLVPSDVIARTQSCPFCAAANETTVQLSPVRTRVPIKTTITDLDGKKIKGVVVNRPTNPWTPGGKWEFPTYTVPRRQDFVITVNNRGNRASISTSLLATTGQFSIGTEGATVPARGVAALGLVPEKGVVVYGTSGKQKDLGALSFIDEGPASSVQVIGQTKAGVDTLMLGRFDEKDNRVVLFTPSRKSTQAQSVAYFQDATGQLLSAQLRARIPANGRLIIDYARWNTSRPTGLRAWVQAKGKKTKVKVSVTDDA
jgi:hypothetical protein